MTGMILVLENSFWIACCFLPGHMYKEIVGGGFPDGSVMKNLPVNARDTGSIPDLGRSQMQWSK